MVLSPEVSLFGLFSHENVELVDLLCLGIKKKKKNQSMEIHIHQNYVIHI